MHEHESRSILQREFEVLAKGGISGLGQGFSRSMQDLGAFASDLRVKPGEATYNLIADHWHEAAIGAGISFLTPRKYLNLALLAVSGRGLGIASYDAMLAAADQNQDLKSVKARFAADIAGETRLFLNALPATLAGAAAGRSAANLVFGKGLGALDLASGKVSLESVRSNLWQASDKLFPPKARLAVFDLDATLVSSNKHLALGIEAGSAKIAEASGLSRQTVAGLLQEQFGKLKSFSNPWTVELALAEKLQVGKPGGMSYEQFRSKISDPYWKVFEETAAENLQVYKGVRQTLDGLAAENVKSIVFTNSAGFGALPRLQLTNLDRSFTNSIMLDNVKPPSGLSAELIKHGQERLAAVMDKSAVPVSIIERQMAKPNAEYLNLTIKEAGLRPSQVLMIGDSLASDMLVAQRSGARGLWARWSEIDAPYDAMLNKVSGGNFPPQAKLKVPFELELHSPQQILQNLRPARDISGLAKSTLALPPALVPLQSYGYSERK